LGASGSGRFSSIRHGGKPFHRAGGPFKFRDAVLADLPHRQGPVFLSDKRRPYADRRGAYGGQIKKGWYGAIRRAGLDLELTPNDLRHTWVSWHYGLHRDLLALKIEGAWSSVALVERYAHLLPAGHEAEIRRFLGWHQAGTDPQAAQATP
jgi:integrase